MTHVRDALEVEAIQTDRYLESLLAGSAAVAPDPAVAAAAGRLGRELVRVHPSFRFEDRLAHRLAEVAATIRARSVGGPEGLPVQLLPFPIDPGLDPADPSLDAEGRSSFPRPGPLLVGGAVASAAISIAGAAFVAWRLSRPAGDPLGLAGRVAGAVRPNGSGGLP